MLCRLSVSCVEDDEDVASMGGSNSLIQGSGCHATACAGSDALQNSRRVRGHCLRGGTKCTSTGTGAKVWLSDEIRGSLSHQKPVSLHVETWAGSHESPLQEGFQVREFSAGCENNWDGCKWRKLTGLGCGFSGVIFQGRIFFLPLPYLQAGLKRGRITQRGRSLGIPCARAHMRMGMAQLSGHTRVSGVGYCSRVCGGLSHP